MRLSKWCNANIGCNQSYIVLKEIIGQGVNDKWCNDLEVINEEDLVVGLKHQKNANGTFQKASSWTSTPTTI